VFEGYVRDDLATGRLVSVLEDWLPPFPGPFLYYPSRRQPPRALAAFVGFVAEWRKRERRVAVPENSGGSERQGGR
jgi:DNA-binding transcriptional LysR family regulator